MSVAGGRIVPDWLNVSRETLALLEQFAALVEKWNPAINLVSKRSIPEIWERHVLDSAQLFSYIPGLAKHHVDLGSGGGFPGVIVAILARDAMPDLHSTLIEVDRRKATFLSEAARQLALPVTIAVSRIETLPPQLADVVTVRALSPMTELCGLVHRHMGVNGIALIAKGAQAEDELAQARPVWSFDVERHPSKSDDGATVLAIRNLRHV